MFAVWWQVKPMFAAWWQVVPVRAVWWQVGSMEPMVAMGSMQTKGLPLHGVALGFIWFQLSR